MSNYEDYSPINVSPFEFTDPQHQSDVMAESIEQRLGLAENGQHFSAIHTNRAFTEEPTIIRMNSLFGSTANADQQYIATQYGAAFPENAYLSLDLPAHGASDKLTKEQRKDIAKTNGSLQRVAHAQLEAAIDLIPELDEIILTGEALGELFAVEFAAQALSKGITVKNLFGFDPMAMEDRSPLALASSYLGNAQMSRNKRAKKSEPDNSGEQALEDAFSKIFVPKIEKFGPTKEATQVGHAGLMARERTVLRLMFKKSPITRATGMDALEQALHYQPMLRANLVFAGHSVVGRLTNPVQERLETMQEATDGHFQFDEWPNDNQDIGLARNQPRLIKYVKDNL